MVQCVYVYVCVVYVYGVGCMYGVWDVCVCVCVSKYVCVHIHTVHVCTVVSAHVLMCVRRSEDNLGCFSARAILGHLEAVSLTDLECANKAKCIDQQVLPLSLRAEIGSVCYHNQGAWDQIWVLTLEDKHFH